MGFYAGASNHGGTSTIVDFFHKLSVKRVGCSGTASKLKCFPTPWLPGFARDFAGKQIGREGGRRSPAPICICLTPARVVPGSRLSVVGNAYGGPATLTPASAALTWTNLTTGATCTRPRHERHAGT